MANETFLDDGGLAHLWEGIKSKIPSTPFTGKNLLPNQGSTNTNGTLTFTHKDDGRVVVTGTANERWTGDFVGTITLAPGSYRLNGAPAGGSGSRWHTSVLNASTGVEYGSLYDNGNDPNGSLITVTADTLDNRYDIYIYIGSNTGTISDSLTWYPMIRVAEDTDYSYEPYVSQLSNQILMNYFHYRNFSAIPKVNGLYYASILVPSTNDSPYPSTNGMWDVIQFGNYAFDAGRMTQIAAQDDKTLAGERELWIRNYYHGTWSEWKKVGPNPSAYSAEVTLTTSGWSSNSQTVTVVGMTADCMVFCQPTATSKSAYQSAGVACTAQAANSLTFTCTSTPSANLTVNVSFFFEGVIEYSGLPLTETYTPEGLFSKNIIRNNASTQTVNGVSFRRYDAGYFYVYGTATADSFLILYNGSGDFLKKSPNTDYILSQGLATYDWGYLYISVLKNGVYQGDLVNCLNSYSVSFNALNKDYDNMIIGIFVRSSKKADGFIYPMIRHAYIENSNYLAPYKRIENIDLSDSHAYRYINMINYIPPFYDDLQLKTAIINGNDWTDNIVEEDNWETGSLLEWISFLGVQVPSDFVETNPWYVYADNPDLTKAIFEGSVDMTYRSSDNTFKITGYSYTTEKYAYATKKLLLAYYI